MMLLATSIGISFVHFNSICFRSLLRDLQPPSKKFFDSDKWQKLEMPLLLNFPALKSHELALLCHNCWNSQLIWVCVWDLRFWLWCNWGFRSCGLTPREEGTLVSRSEMRSLLCNSALSQHYIPEDLKPQHDSMLEQIFSIFFFPGVSSGFVLILLISHFILFFCFLCCCYCHICSNYFCCLFHDSRARYFCYVLLTVVFDIFVMFFWQLCSIFSLCSFDSCVRYFRYVLLTAVLDNFVMFFWQLCPIFSLHFFII